MLLSIHCARLWVWNFQCIFSLGPQNNPTRKVVLKFTVLKMRKLKHREVI